MQRPHVRRSPLSVHRAFVVQFRTETDASHGHIVGRVEHVASQQSAAFHSWGEMRSFMAQTLTQVQAQRPEAP